MPLHPSSRSSIAPAHWLGLLALAWLLAGCVSIRTDLPRPDSFALPATESTPLGDTVAELAAAHPGQSGFRLLPRGNQALTARHALALAARRTLDLQYYIINDDPTSRTLLRLATQAAERGVRVRLLIDDIHTDGRDQLAAAFARHPNIDVRVFNPFRVRGTMGFWRTAEFLVHNDRLNRRMHNKAMIADNAVAIVGGRNLGEEYFGTGAATAFVDLDVLAAGPVAQQTSAAFDAYWNSPYAIPVEHFLDTLPDALPPVGTDVTPLPGAASLASHLLAGTVPLTWAPAEVLYDLPEKAGGEASAAREGVRIGPRIRQMLLGAKKQLTLVSAYFVPRDLGVKQFKALVDQGVRVRIVTNSLGANDVIPAHGGYAHYRPGLARAGVELYELRPLEPVRDPELKDGGSGPFHSRTSLHAKTMVVDGRTVVIGSFNGDPRSVWLNTETAVVIDSEALALELRAGLDEVLATQCYRVSWRDDRLVWERDEGGVKVTTDVEPDTTAWRRFLSEVLWTVTPESFL